MSVRVDRLNDQLRRIRIEGSSWRFLQRLNTTLTLPKSSKTHVSEAIKAALFELQKRIPLALFKDRLLHQPQFMGIDSNA